MSNQKELQNLQDEIIRATRMVVVASVLSNQRMAETLNINATDLQLMNILDLFGSLTPKQLAEKTGLSTPGVTVALDRLERAGHLKRIPNIEDRRSLLIQKVSNSVHSSYRNAEKAERDLLAEYSHKKLETILHFLINVNSLEI